MQHTQTHIIKAQSNGNDSHTRNIVQEVGSDVHMFEAFSFVSNAKCKTESEKKLKIGKVSIQNLKIKDYKMYISSFKAIAEQSRTHISHSMWTFPEIKIKRMQ